MKVIWEASDIRGGRRAKKPGTMGQGVMVGYEAGGKEKRWGLISLDDGCIIYNAQSQEAIAIALTENGDVPLELLDAGDKP